MKKYIRAITEKLSRLSKYEKLTTALLEAKEAAGAVSKSEDMRISNDKIFLRLAWNKKKVIESIRKSGLHCDGKTEWFGMGYMISLPCAKENNAIAVETMRRILDKKGYDVLPYYHLN